MLSQSGEVKLSGLHFATDLLGLTQNGSRKDDDFKVSIISKVRTKLSCMVWGSNELLHTSEIFQIYSTFWILHSYLYFQDDILSLGMMVTKLAHGTGTKLQGASDKPYASLSRDQEDSSTRQFSPNFGDFLTTCLQTNPKQVSLKQLHVAQW